METKKIVEWTLTILFILFLFWMGGLVLSVGFGILGIVGSVLGALISLVFSKNFLTLLAIGLVVYLLWNRSSRQRCRNRHNYRW